MQLGHQQLEIQVCYTDKGTHILVAYQIFKAEHINKYNDTNLLLVNILTTYTATQIRFQLSDFYHLGTLNQRTSC